MLFVLTVIRKDTTCVGMCRSFGMYCRRKVSPSRMFLNGLSSFKTVLPTANHWTARALHQGAEFDPSCFQRLCALADCLPGTKQFTKLQNSFAKHTGCVFKTEVFQFRRHDKVTCRQGFVHGAHICLDVVGPEGW